MKQQKTLPDGWIPATIADLVGSDGVFNDGDWVESKDQDPHGDVRLIQLADVGDGRYVNKSSRFLTNDKAVELRCTFLLDGDVLIARMPDPLGRACIFPGDEKRSVTVVDVCVVRTGNSKVDHRWLMWFINSPSFRIEVASLQSGSTRKRISRRNLARITLPVPPLNEQSRIVNKIEELFSDLDAGVAALERVQKALKRYRASVLKAAVEGKLTAEWRAENTDVEPASELLRRILAERRNKWEADQLAKYEAAGKKPPKNWREKYKEPAEPDSTDLPESLPPTWSIASMEQLTSTVTSGSRDWSQYYGRGTGTFLMAQNVRPGNLDLSFRQAVDPPEDNRDRVRSQILQDDLLVTIVGANTGDVCRVPEELPEHYVCQSVALMRPVVHQLSRFIELYMVAEQGGQRHYRRYIYGQGRPHLSFDQIKITPVIVPPLPEQEAIIDIVEEKLSIIDQAQLLLDAAVRRASRLRQSILKRAFEGQLVPQDPNDEPAEKLLGRIKADRELAAAQNGSPKRKKSAKRKATKRA